MQQVLEVLGALTPSVGVGLIFWFAMRKIISADRNERVAQAALDRQQQSESGRGSVAEPSEGDDDSSAEPGGNAHVGMRSDDAAAPAVPVLESSARPSRRRPAVTHER
jgi:hypothetical protein